MNEWKNGLPLVGELIRIKGTPTGLSCEGVIDYIDERHCVWHWVESNGKTSQTIHARVSEMEFSPLKSEAERKREEFTSEMYLTLNEFDGIAMRQSTAQDLLKHLYDAGLRKVNPLTDKQISSFTDAAFQTSSSRVSWMNGAKWARSRIMGEES